MEYYKEANRFLQKYGSDAFKIIAAYEVAADISRTERYADWYGDYGIFEPSLNEDMTYDKLLSRYKVGLKYLGIIHEQTKAVCGNFLSEQLAEHICSGDHPLHRWDLDKDLSLHWMCGSWPESDPFDC